MINRNLRVLEYNKIMSKVEELASSNLAKEIIRDIRPLNDVDEIKNMQEITSEIVSLIIAKGNFPFGPLYDLKSEIKLAEIGSILSPRQLLQCSDSLRTVRNVHSFINNAEDVKEKYPKLLNLATNITPLKKIEDEINNAIINENQISDNASSMLRKIRRSIENKQESIRNKLNSYLSSTSMQKYLQDSIITIRNNRFVIPVKSEHKGMVKGIIHDQSTSGATNYIEPMAVVELNNELNNLRIDEEKEIERILKVLTGYIGEKASVIRLNFEILTEIDVVLAKGKYSLEIDGIEPKITQEKYLKIKSGKHPLIGKKEVVPIDMEIGNGYESLVITGPNTGGKTVALKTVGLLCLMFQSGLHVPAKYGTTMPVFDYIFADIGDEQSIEQSLSTFSSHMTNIVEILKKATTKSLVLLDELGAGTDPIEGAALAMAILKKLHSKEIITISTTHYSELKHYALSTEGIKNACVEFDIKTLRPTYRLIIGMPGKSNAFEISRKLGLDDNIIEKAKGFLESTNIEFEDILEKIKINLTETENDKKEIVLIKNEVQKLKEKLSEKNEKLEESRNKVLRGAREEAKRILTVAKKESDEIIKELRSIDLTSREDNKKIEQLKNKLKENIKETSENILKKNIDNKEIPKDLNVGDVVKILSLDNIGDVISKPDKEGNFTAQVGIMKIKVNIKDVVLDKSEKKEDHIIAKSYTLNKKMDINSQIDLRGMDLEEAKLNVDKYLDDAFMAGLNSVQIIHGKGTMVLRKGMQEYLKKHKHVKSQRDGTYREGGIGVTVVEMK